MLTVCDQGRQVLMVDLKYNVAKLNYYIRRSWVVVFISTCLDLDEHMLVRQREGEMI